MSEISDEEVDYGSFESSVNPSRLIQIIKRWRINLRMTVKFAVHEGMQTYLDFSSQCLTLILTT